MELGKCKCDYIQKYRDKLKNLHGIESNIDKDKLLGNIFDISCLPIDGKDFITLVSMYGCNLSCKYCTNKDVSKYYKLSCETLFDLLCQDSMDLEYSGVCFSGHEPLLQPEFILSFMDLVKSKGLKWRFGIETSLNIELNDRVKELLDRLDYIIVDIKDMTSAIYTSYTGKSIDLLYKNLKYLSNLYYRGDLDITLRIPFIPNFNSRIDMTYSMRVLDNLGFNIDLYDIFDYVDMGSMLDK